MAYPKYLPRNVIAHLESNDCAEKAGMRNAYVCETCGWRMFAVLRDAGTTWFVHRCPNCGGDARSRCYLGVPPKAFCTAEFYRPDDAEFVTLSAWNQDHCRQGGLLLRLWTYHETKRRRHEPQSDDH